MRRHPEVMAPASAGAFLAFAPLLAQAAGAGAEYGLCGAVAAAAGVGAIPFALETREAPTAVALGGLGGLAWGSYTAWACWSDAPSLARMAIGTFLTVASAGAGAVIRWRREGTPIERVKLEIERAKLDVAEVRRDAVSGVSEEASGDVSEQWPVIPGTVWSEPDVIPGTTDPIDVGGGVILPLTGGHIIMGGATGAGKSVFIADVIANLLPREKMRITVIDPKGDALLNMLRNSSVVMSNFRNAEKTMKEHLATMVRRGAMVEAAADAYTLGKGPLPSSMWIPTEEEPWDVIIVDEFTDFAGTEVMEIIVEIARKSRSLGQTLILDTQSLEAALFKTQSSTSGGGPRSQFSTRVAGRLETADESKKVFGNGEEKTWAAHRMPGEGHVLVRSALSRDPVMRRVPDMDMATLAAWARKCSERKKFEEEFPVTPTNGPRLTLVREKPGTQGEAVIRYLDDNGASSLGSIAAGSGVPRGSLGKVLQRLSDDGCVTKRDGLWEPL